TRTEPQENQPFQYELFHYKYPTSSLQISISSFFGYESLVHGSNIPHKVPAQTRSHYSPLETRSLTCRRSETPANMSFLRRVASMAATTFGSSHALTEARSIMGSGPTTSTSSGKVGPHMLSRAVVVTMVGTPSTFAALARATTLRLSSPVS